MEIQQQKPLWHGIILVAGGAVGAGMFALPMVSAGAWFTWSLFGLIMVWYVTYFAAKLLIEVNLEFPQGSSFDTLVRSTLGARWAFFNNASIAFIMYILMYAYITAGAGILQFSLGEVLESKVDRGVLSIIFGVSVAIFIWLGTSVVSRVSSILMASMCVAFVTANTGMLANANWASLLQDTKISNLSFLSASLPVYVTAFACAGLVPSLVKHYPASKKRINQSVFYGSLLALCIYLIWLAATMGNISRLEFIEVAKNGSGLSSIVGALDTNVADAQVSALLTWFSHFAVITSFLSVALGLAHFLTDRFGFSGDKIGKFKAVLIAFLPPLVMSLAAPYGFVSAIGFAGLFVALSFFVVPALMHRHLLLNSQLKTQRGMVLMFGCLIVLLKLALLLSVLPVYV